MSDDIKEPPPRRRRPEPPIEPPDDPDVAYGDELPYPWTVMTAGVGLIVVGVMVLLPQVVLLAFLLVFVARDVNKFMGSFNQAQGAGLACVGGTCSLLGATLGAFFVLAGMRFVRGTARGTEGTALATIFFALLVCGWGLLTINTDSRWSVLMTLLGAAILAPGILALMGRSRYTQWRTAQEFRRKREGASKVDDLRFRR